MHWVCIWIFCWAKRKSISILSFASWLYHIQTQKSIRNGHFTRSYWYLTELSNLWVSNLRVCYVVVILYGMMFRCSNYGYYYFNPMHFSPGITKVIHTLKSKGTFKRTMTHGIIKLFDPEYPYQQKVMTLPLNILFLLIALMKKKKVNIVNLSYPTMTNVK